MVPRPTIVTRATVRLIYEATEAPVSMPEVNATTLRGPLGAAFRWWSCTTGTAACAGCPRIATCPYGSVWELAQSAGPSSAAGYVIEAAIDDRPRTVPKGRTFGLQLHLFGATRAHLPTLLLSARDAGAAGFGPPDARRPATLREAWQVDRGGENVLLYTTDRGVLETRIEQFHRVRLRDASDEPRRVRLRFESPLGMVRKSARGERELVPFEPMRFTRLLVDRADALRRLYEHAPPWWDRDAIVEASRGCRVESLRARPYQQQRYSSRAGGRLDLAGWLGEATIAAVPDALLAWWELAEKLHVGRSTMVGFGRVSARTLTSVP